MTSFPDDYAYDDKNPFALILKGELPCAKVFENETVLAFKDIHPKQPIHVLIIPKGPYICYSDFVSQASEAEVSSFFKSIKAVAKALKVSQYTILTNNGEEAGQVVYHFHVHLLAKNSD